MKIADFFCGSQVKLSFGAFFFTVLIAPSPGCL